MTGTGPEVHFQNADKWDDYLSRVEAGQSPVARAFPTSDRERMVREFLLTLKRGEVSFGPLDAKHGVHVAEEFAPQLEDLEQRGLAQVDGEHVELTRAGLLRVDQLLPAFYDEQYRNARYT